MNEQYVDVIGYAMSKTYISGHNQKELTSDDNN